ncbi:MAG: tol-pal system-associated acyl-CoA thioesterase, partial [Parvularculaceae bacterium]
VRVYYEDTDFSGVVYHANTLKFFERGRTEALRECGFSHAELLGEAEPIVFAVRKMAVEWIAPAKIDDLLTVETRFLAGRGARLALEQEIRRDETPIARADVEVAAMNLSGKPRRLPAAILEKFSSLTSAR